MQNPKCPEWVDVYLNGELVQINSKGIVRPQSVGLSHDYIWCAADNGHQLWICESCGKEEIVYEDTQP